MTFKNILIIAFFAILTAPILAQTKAKTTDGKEVVLYDDGTWQFADDEDLKEEGKKVFIKTSDIQYKKANTAKTVYKGRKVPFTLYYNNLKWQPTQKQYEDHEALFKLKTGDAYAMVIAEGIEVPMETLGNIALQNAQNAAPGTKMTHQEYRSVNGKDILHMKLEGTIHGINFVYFGYYFSCKEGSLQIVGYTSANLFDKYKSEIEEFLNGLDYPNQ